MQAGGRFPRIEAADLEGLPCVLPEGLPDGPRVVAVTFQRRQHAEARAWLARVAALHVPATRPSLSQLIAISTGYRVIRDFMFSAMFAAVSDPEERRRTFIAFTDLRAFCDDLGLQTMATTYVYLLDRRGFVYCRGAGEPDDAQLEGMRRALARL
jgi:hypothetical protein